MLKLKDQKIRKYREYKKNTRYTDENLSLIEQNSMPSKVKTRKN
jgi:hypothetical protein